MSEVRVRRSGEHKEVSAPWGALTWFASKELGNADEMTVGRCVLRPGQANPRHSHPNCEEVLHVLRGRIAHSVSGDEAVEMTAGDTITIPPEVPHNARNLGSEDAVLMICFGSGERETRGE